MPNDELPLLEFIILSDYAALDPIIGKVNITGIFDHFDMVDFDKPVNPFAMTVRFRGGSGERQVETFIRDAAGARIEGPSAGAILDFSKGDFTVLVVFIYGLKFPHAGRFEFGVTVDENEIERPFACKVLEAQPVHSP